MAAIENDPPLARDRSPAGFLPKRPSRARPIVAALLVIVMGLLAAASVLASRPYLPAEHARAGASPAQQASPGQHPDPC